MSGRSDERIAAEHDRRAAPRDTRDRRDPSDLRNPREPHDTLEPRDTHDPHDTHDPRGRRITRAVRAGIETDSAFGAVVPPLHLSANFAFEGFGRKRAHDYTRTGNPTRDLLAEALADLEGGAGAVVTSSGMSAIALVLHLLEPGDLLLAPHDGYGGSHRLFTALARRRQLALRFVDWTAPATLDEVFAADVPRPRLVWLETPSNPLLRITDIAAVAARAHAAGALVAVDNTFLSPIWQQPTALGADLVVHSTTKYLNGHSDVVGGAVVAKDAALAEELRWWANCIGVTGAPFDAWLTLRGLRTLDARMRVHASNARVVVECLVGHPAVRRVLHPSLPDHPGRELADRQQREPGAIVSLELEGGLRAVAAFVEGLRCFSLAESLGGVESLVAHPATMTHAAMEADARARAGIDDALVRLSVGIEDARDLVGDLERGLQRVLAATRSGHAGAQRDAGARDDASAQGHVGAQARTGAPAHSDARGAR